MPKPQNVERKNTTIAISKAIKEKIRRCARPSQKRKGYETDEEVIDRLSNFYMEQNPVPLESHTTY